jgi:hypothetical protein
MPKIKDFTFRIISSNEQADELATDGIDIRAYSSKSRQGLDKGAIAFCIFIGRELGEACTGGTVTLPKYRGNGLMAYGYFQRFRFLRERGIVVSRNAVAKNNVISQRVHAKFNPEVHAKGYYLKILWWKFWKEVSITDATNH